VKKVEAAVGGLAQGEEILVAAPAVSGRPHRIPIRPLLLLGIAFYLTVYLLPARILIPAMVRMFGPIAEWVPLLLFVLVMSALALDSIMARVVVVILTDRRLVLCRTYPYPLHRLVFRGYAAGLSWVSSTSGNRSRVCWSG
jgi:hypothetical protein